MSKRKAKPDTSGAAKQIRPLVWGVAAGIAVIIIVLTLMALALSFGEIPQILIQPMVVIAAAAGAFGGGFVSSRMVTSKGLFVSLGCGAVLFAIIMFIGVATVPEGFGGIAFVKLFAVLIASAIGGVMGTNSRYSRR